MISEIVRISKIFSTFSMTTVRRGARQLFANNPQKVKLTNPIVVFQASCCQRWFECSECHDEINDHPFQFNKRLKMFCKTCNTTFERDLKLMTVKDKYCYSCGTCWCIPGVTPESIIAAEGLAHMDDGLQSLLNNAGKTL